MVHPSRPALPPSRPYCRPLNYLEYIKDSDPDAHVKVFKAPIRTNSETYDAKIDNMLSFTLRVLCLIGVIIIWEIIQIVFMQNWS
jgi:hypothetical protein